MSCQLKNMIKRDYFGFHRKVKYSNKVTNISWERLINGLNVLTSPDFDFMLWTWRWNGSRWLPLQTFFWLVTQSLLPNEGLLKQAAISVVQRKCTLNSEIFHTWHIPVGCHTGQYYEHSIYMLNSDLTWYTRYLVWSLSNNHALFALYLLWLLTCKPCKYLNKHALFTLYVTLNWSLSRIWNVRNIVEYAAP